MNFDDLTFFRDSLLEAVRLSGSTVENISRPVYLAVCKSYGIDGLTKEEIQHYKEGWTHLKRSAMRTAEIESQDFEIPEITGDKDDITVEEALYILEPDTSNVCEDLFKDYDKFVKLNKYVPRLSVFRKFTEETELLRKMYHNDMSLLDNDYRINYKENASTYLFDKKSWNSDYVKAFNEELKKHKKFIFVSVGSFCNVDFNFLSAIKNYANMNGAMVIGLPLFKRYDKALYDFCISPDVRNYMWITFEDVILNSNLRAVVYKASCTGKSSITSMNQLVSRYDSSIIMPGSYQQLKYIPVMKDKTPYMMSSTGCCTDYEPVRKDEEVKIFTKSEKLTMDRLSMKAALVVELGDNDTFTVRNIEADKDGSFIDLALKYHSDGETVEDITGSTFIIGDLHAPNQNEALVEANLNAIWEYNCSQVVLHDSVNMAYVSHHNAEKSITRAQLIEEGKANVLAEVNALANILEDIAKLPCVKDIVIPYSNHPSHLEQTIQNMSRMSKDDINLRTMLHSAIAMLDKKIVLQYLTEELVGVKIDKVVWMKEDEGRKAYGVQIGLHGCEKVNGGRMTPTSTNNAFKKTVLAHRHSAGIDGDTITVGIACEKDQGYNKGLSSWTNSSAIVYPNGKVQLLTFVSVKGEYKLWL